MPCGDVLGRVHVCMAGVSAGRAAEQRLALAVLLEGEIPQIPGMGAMLAQDLLLFWRWLQPVPGHESNVLATTDILEGVKRRFLPHLAGVSSPQS
jgi:hypothetical protein